MYLLLTSPTNRLVMHKTPTRKRHLEKAFGNGAWNCSEPLEEQQGVCPYELERLHGLMERRQKKEIKEQQTALGEAKKGFM
ncbi:hypothetical protein YC2023_110236 [Brassica napus]|uniref:(rape) hypothetical protein n=1 Tax=Brassica napus TaxID=3708 RepID=A0A816PC65_BRANA|nr:unnamed protein product [Brassica napus]